MDGIITAGGRLKGAFARQVGVSIKALMLLEGKTLLERTVSAMRGSRFIERVCVIGPAEVEAPARAAGADLFVLERTTGIDNMLAGIEALQSQGRVIQSASDLPFLTAGDIDDVAQKTPPDACLSYVVLERSEVEAEIDAPHATYIRFRDGEFTGGSVFALDAPTLRRIEPVLQRAFAARKSQVGMVRLLGPSLTLRMLLGQVVRGCLPTTEDARRRVEQLIGCPCALVRGCSTGVARDVDNAEDWEDVQRIAAAQKTPSGG